MDVSQLFTGIGSPDAFMRMNLDATGHKNTTMDRFKALKVTSGGNVVTRSDVYTNLEPIVARIVDMGNQSIRVITLTSSCPSD